MEPGGTAVDLGLHKTSQDDRDPRLSPSKMCIWLKRKTFYGIVLLVLTTA